MSINATPNSFGVIQQMYDGDQELNKKLMDLSYKDFKPGHGVLLAKAIADTIALPPSGVEDFSMWFLTQKLNVISILDKLSGFIYISNKEEIYKLAKDFAQWRYSMIYNPPHILCLNGTQCMLDEVSGITNFVDRGALASMLDVYNDASYYYMTFRTLASTAKGNSN